MKHSKKPELLKASTADALTIIGISRRAFHSDVEVGSGEKYEERNLNIIVKREVTGID